LQRGHSTVGLSSENIIVIVQSEVSHANPNLFLRQLVGDEIAILFVSLHLAKSHSGFSTTASITEIAFTSTFSDKQRPISLDFFVVLLCLFNRKIADWIDVDRRIASSNVNSILTDLTPLACMSGDVRTYLQVP
jgi:hypothetical protein